MIAINSKDDIYGNFPALYVLMFGLVSAKVTNRLVVSKDFCFINGQNHQQNSIVFLCWSIN